MSAYIYRPEAQAIFSGRENELAQLERHLLRKRPTDLHLSGLRRIVKSMRTAHVPLQHFSTAGQGIWCAADNSGPDRYQ